MKATSAVYRNRIVVLWDKLPQGSVWDCPGGKRQGQRGWYWKLWIDATFHGPYPTADDAKDAIDRDGRPRINRPRVL